MDEESQKRLAVWSRIENGTASEEDHALAFEWGRLEQLDSYETSPPHEKWMMVSGGDCFDCWSENSFVPERVAFSLDHVLVFAILMGKAEIDNGGFDHFFRNPTGVLAPELLLGFYKTGMDEWANIVKTAMARFGEPYPRDLSVRLERVNSMGISCDDLDEDFFQLNYHVFETKIDSYFRKIDQIIS